MSTVNDIEVTIANGFITIKNTNNPNASIEKYNLLHVTSVNEYYQDYTALNAYQPGSKRYEFNEEFTVLLDIEENPTDLVKIQFDVQNVTNQAGWLASRAGLAQAVADITAGVTAATGGGGSTPSTAYTSGGKTVAVVGTPEALAASTAITKVDVTALSTNTMTLVVGDATVDATPATRTGTPLDAGDTVTIEIDDLAKVYVDVLFAGEGVSFNYYN
jgi:hypothetical protein